MATIERVIEKLGSLVAEAKQIEFDADEYNNVDEHADNQALAWITSAHNAIVLACPDAASPYRRTIDALIVESATGSQRWFMARIAALLVQVEKDAGAGLLTSLADGIRAELFDDFLEHAKHYIQSSKKSEAGVIAGVVFEDSLRRLCAKRQIAEKGVALDLLITALTADGTLSTTKAKRARAAAHVRTKATHAQWDEYDMRDVESAIDFTEEVLLLLDR